ncbi:MAG: GNAT family N-acetyltransferase [Candidatus Eremiobacteraeota bacterium]|nr:GNAT family N-acetyltransferase [Candidatus Eremiobacteraeota bacterium]MBV8499597.1 GNAT family N-acetyltransferase [Candidatus Eremiobacteraeota bacterium]
MHEILNLVVDLARERMNSPAPAGVEIGAPVRTDERTLAWIDETFGGAWSSEAAAGRSIVARRAGSPVGFATIEPHGLTYSWLEGLAREPGVGVFGPFGVAPEERGKGVGRTLLGRALGELRVSGYRRAIIPAVGDERLARYYARCSNAELAERFDCATLLRPQRRTLVMASGNGSNFQAVLDAAREGAIPLEIVGLIVNSEAAHAIERARGAGIRATIVSWNREREPRAEYDARLLEAASAESPDLVLLLGWMHLLSRPFVAAFPEMFNLHPAFLPLDPARDDVVLPDGTRIPAFRGPRAVRDALNASAQWVGATLHRVTAATDRGPVMARRPLRVRPGEDEAHLMERVHAIERGVVRAGITRWLYERSG